MTFRLPEPMNREGRPFDRTGPVARSGRVTLVPTARKPTLGLRSKKAKASGDEEKPISILLIEDNRLFRLGLTALLKKQRGLKLLAALERPEPIPQLAPEQRPDVILLDLGLGDRGSLEAVRGIRVTYPQARLIVMGLIPAVSEILGLMKQGVSGFVLKDASMSDFIAAIRAAAAGQKVFPASLTDSLFSQIVEDATRTGKVEFADVRMTGREREIVDLIADGLSNKEIARRLSIATDTVKSHVHNILEKLSLRSRVEVAVRAGIRVASAR